MSEAETDIAPPPPPVKRGRPFLAWLVIGLVIAFVLYRNAAGEAVLHEQVEGVTLEVQGRYLVGAADFFGQNKEVILKQVETIETSDYEQRLCVIVLEGELAGPAEALQRLRQLPAEEGADTETAKALETIYHAASEKPPAAPPASAVERAREKLGWFGKLAAVPPGTPDVAAREAVLRSARRTMVVSLLAFLVALLGVVGGLATLTVTAVMAWTRRLRFRLATGSPYGGIYAETFAVWFVLFLVLGSASHLIPARGSQLLVHSVVSLVSLAAALAWPVARGVPWRVVRYDIGLSAGSRPVAEVLAGFGTYAAALPLLACSVLLMLLVVSAAKKFGHSVHQPGHPLAPFLMESGVWGWVQAFLAASVAAPIVEETMFRGVLYRHLRECTAGAGRVLSVLASVALVSFVFAMIHPQGWLGVPVLMALATVFCLAREWRGSLLPAMVAHGINNGVVTVLVILSAG
jgi:membrane protease YdiL (CAAX protease family)